MWKEFKETWKTAEPELKIMKGIEEELFLLHKEYYLVLAGQYGSKLIKLLKKMIS